MPMITGTCIPGKVVNQLTPSFPIQGKTRSASNHRALFTGAGESRIACAPPPGDMNTPNSPSPVHRLPVNHCLACGPLTRIGPYSPLSCSQAGGESLCRRCSSEVAMTMIAI